MVNGVEKRKVLRMSHNTVSKMQSERLTSFYLEKSQEIKDGDND